MIGILVCRFQYVSTTHTDTDRTDFNSSNHLCVKILFVTTTSTTMSTVPAFLSTMASPLSSPDHHQYRFLSIHRLQDDPSVVVVALNRPNKRNALHAAMWKEIGHVFSTLGTTGDGSRCVLLVGHGKSFCAGIDVTDPAFFAPDHNDVARKGVAFRQQVLEMQDCFSALEKRCPLPVVAAVHGACVGAGIDLITCADLRYCAPDTVFSVREARLGLAADVGTLQRLPKVVGYGSLVRELCLTGRDFGPVEAAGMGLVSAAGSDYLEKAIETCKAIARNSPLAVEGTKASLNYSRDHTVQEGLHHIAMHNAVALQTSDMMDSLMAVHQGKPPVFADMLPHSKL